MNTSSVHRKKDIAVVKGIGSGSTELAAFDSALLSCGIGNYNLIRLSSVVPPNTKILHKDKIANDFGGWGDKLYVVYAEISATVSGKEAWAGIGWVVLEENGAGLFVEHEANSEQECRRLLQETLSDLCKSRGYTLEDYTHNYEVIGVTCKDRPVAALVAAVYEAAGWGM